MIETLALLALLVALIPIGALVFALWGAVVFAEPLESELPDHEPEPEITAIRNLEERLGEEIAIAEGSD